MKWTDIISLVPSDLHILNLVMTVFNFVYTFSVPGSLSYILPLLHIRSFLFICPQYFKKWGQIQLNTLIKPLLLWIWNASHRAAVEQVLNKHLMLDLQGDMLYLIKKQFLRVRATQSRATWYLSLDKYFSQLWLFFSGTKWEQYHLPLRLLWIAYELVHVKPRAQGLVHRGHLKKVAITTKEDSCIESYFISWSSLPNLSTLSG